MAEERCELENVNLLDTRSEGWRAHPTRGSCCQDPWTDPVRKTPSVGAIDLPEEGIDLKEALERMEQSLIRQALARAEEQGCGGDALGLNRTTLIEN